MSPADGGNENSQQPGKSPHHYVLGHLALRQICQENPLGFFGIIGSEERDEFLKDIWEQVRKNCDPDGTPSFDISDVGITTSLLKGFPCIIISMPPPQVPPEAHFAGIVLRIDMSADKPPENPEISYLTLEKGLSRDGEERTMLGGWTDQDSHVTYGAGPPATQADFVAAMEALL
ncbi:MAG: hypothetical protein V2A76_13495 [Planctomycetota bacterium]